MAEWIDEATDVFECDEMLLERYFHDGPRQIAFDYGAVSDRGKVRSENQDHYAIIRRRRTRDVLKTNLPAASLPAEDLAAYSLVVADGMGGTQPETSPVGSRWKRRGTSPVGRSNGRGRSTTMKPTNYV